MIPTLTPAFIIPEGIGGGISGGGGSVATTAAGVVAAAVVVGGLAVVAAPVVGALAAKAAVLTTAGGPGLLAIGAFLKGLEQLREWGWLNHRNPLPTPTIPEAGDEFVVTTGADVLIGVSVDRRIVNHSAFSCSSGQQLTAETSANEPNWAQHNYGGVKVVMGRNSVRSDVFCGSGPVNNEGPVVLYQVINAAGNVAGGISVSGISTSFNPFNRWASSVLYQNFRITVNGAQVPWTRQGQREPVTRPQLFPQTLPDAPPLPAPPLREPLQTPTLPPPPDRRPLAPPVTIPRPGQQPARVPVPGPRPGPAPGPGPSPTPSQPAPAGVPAIGPLPLPIPLPVPTTPGSVVIVDGQPIGGPGQAPAPNLVAIATELGRLERKNEILLSRPENGGGLGPANDVLSGLVRGLLEAVLEAVTGGRDGGTFTLAHACPPSGGGDPPAPVEVAYGGAGNPIDAVSAKLDGIAGLIQAHKTMRQPMCRTPLVGEEVTIHFESDG